MPRPELHASAKDYTPADMADRKGFGELFPPAPEPQTELARYRILSPRSGVRVSPLCLGAMSIGDQWTGWMGGKLDYDESFKFLDAFYEAGGNFIDTANNYQDEQSEMIIGEWMEKRGIRDDIVLATKYTSYGHTRKEGRAKGVGVNYTGNHRKNLMITVDDSLKKLKTSYIDILYLHWWDYTTSVEEIMHALNDLVKSGKVMYLGISDTPAWIVAQANTYAKAHALEQFVVYQGQWSLGDRDMERDVIPMAQAFGMAIAPWGAMGGGKFKSPEELKKREEEGGHLRGGMQQTEAEVKISKALQEVSDELGQGHSVATIALAWVRQKTPYCFPIIGGTKLHHLQANIESLKIHLSDAQMQKLTKAVDFDYGFPYTFFGRDPHYLPGGKPNSGLLNHVGHLQLVALPGAETS